MTGHKCTCGLPGDPLSVHASWCMARPSGLLNDGMNPGMRQKTEALSRDLRTKYGMLDDPPKTPATPPAGEAAESLPPCDDAASVPGTSPLTGPRSGGVGVPGTQASHPGRAAQDAAPGAGATWVVALPAGMRLLSLNDRRHWAEKGRITRDLRLAAFAMARKAKIPHLERARVTVVYEPPLNGRHRDVDNIAAAAKPAIDGALVDARVLDSDDSRYLAEVAYRIGEPYPRGRLVLHVEAVAA